MEETETSNFQVFRDCLSTPLIQKSTEQPPKVKKARNNSGRKTVIKPVIIKKAETSDTDELAEFIDVMCLDLPFGWNRLTNQTVLGH